MEAAVASVVEADSAAADFMAEESQVAGTTAAGTAGTTEDSEDIAADMAVIAAAALAVPAVATPLGASAVACAAMREQAVASEAREGGRVEVRFRTPRFVMANGIRLERPTLRLPESRPEPAFHPSQAEALLE